MNNLERRFLNFSTACLDIRADDAAKTKKIIGYASVFYNNDKANQYQIYDKFVERIMPGAFTDAIKNDDVRALFNHDANIILGRSTAGTLIMKEDSRGLFYEIPFDENDDDHVKMMRKIQKKEITGSSFSFRVMDEEMKKEDGINIRTIKKVSLFDVGPVTFPAYKATDASSRYFEGAIDAEKRFIQAETPDYSGFIAHIQARARLAEIS